jgi:hypothetical protein
MANFYGRYTRIKSYGNANGVGSYIDVSPMSMVVTLAEICTMGIGSYISVLPM